ncbi:MAG: ATP-dependent helicase HrpB [Bacteroidales bacterium]|nr:ATP-dependent helicase HrpB [Bacteroidales bacterium]
MIDFKQFDYPICEILSDITQELATKNTLIVHAPPGAGKSTLIPLALLDSPWLKNKKIVMLEPRRLAAKTIAERMAAILNEHVGQTVGYRIRFDNKTSAKTKIEVVTEGILTKMLQSNNEIPEIGVLLFDEFHERSIHADTALALCRETQNILRDDLRIVIMSATLNLPNLQQTISAPVIESKGKIFPVDIKYTGENDLTLLPELTAKVIQTAINTEKGDILVFLPGEAEITKTAGLLYGKYKNVMVHPLYGMLPPNKQYAAIMPDKQGRRKIVLATSIAETSLTIEGVAIVIDCGWTKSMKFDPNSSLSRLETIEISMDSANQRSGRAGRLGPGVCFRMWSKATEDRKKAFRIPEISEADLAPLVLELYQWGVTDIFKLAWLTPPPSGHVKQAEEILELLGAVIDGKITPHGTAINRLPCHPRIAHMLIKAKEDNTIALATDIAAILEERDPLPKDSGIDINLRIEALRKQRKEDRLQAQMSKVERIAAQYRQLFSIQCDNSLFDIYDTGLLLVHAYPERIASATPGNNAQFQLANGRIASIGHKDNLAHESWLAVAHLHSYENSGKIFLASPLNPKDLAQMVKEKITVEWDFRKDALIAAKELRIGNILLQSKPLHQLDSQLVNKAIVDAVKKNGEQLLNFDDEFLQLQNRVICLKLWNSDIKVPDVTTKSLLNHCENWLLNYSQNIRKKEDFKKLNLKEIIYFFLPFDIQKKLNILTPEKIIVPSGSSIKLQYSDNGAAPILAVRLQELFGLADTPVINNGKTKILIHLLSPGYKPVQVTSDLKNFWNNTYYEVKKELKAKYPKHVWPDDPWTEQATSHAKRKIKK